MKLVQLIVVAAVFLSTITAPAFAADRAMEPQKSEGMPMKMEDKNMDGKMDDMKMDGMKAEDKMGRMKKDDKMGTMGTKMEEKDGMKMEGKK